MRKVSLVIILGMIFLTFSQSALAVEAVNLMLGKWVSDRQASVEEMVKAGISKNEIEKLSPLFGQLELEIKPAVYTTIINGRVVDLPYTIISSADNCYQVNIEQKIEKICVVNGKLHVPSYKGSVEVFNKKTHKRFNN